MLRNLLVLGCIIPALGLRPAHADAARDALSEIAKCTTIANPSERLKCFDAAAGAHGFGLPRPPQPVTRPEDFGATPPRAPEVARISATVLELARTARGRALFVLDNGQTWRQLDADGIQVHDPAPGSAMKVTIAKGALDSYSLTIEGRNALVKVRRVK